MVTVRKGVSASLQRRFSALGHCLGMSPSKEPSVGRAARRALLAVVLTAGALAAGVPAATAAPALPIVVGANIAYQDNAGTMQTVTPTGIIHTAGISLAPGTSPSIAAGPGGEYEAVAQADDGVLWSVNARGQSQAQHAHVVPGTSPSISYYDPGGSYQTYFQSAPGKLGNLSGFGGHDLLANDNYTIAPLTSPSTGGGGVAIVSTDDNEVSGVQGVPGYPPLKETQVAPGSSPSLSYFPVPDRAIYREAEAWEQNDAKFDLAYQVIVGQVSGGFTSTGAVLTKLSMMPGTSPAIAVQPDGSYEIAFQSSTGALFLVDSNGIAFNTTDSMDPRSSPAMTALPDGGFEVAFQGSDHSLRTVIGTSMGQTVPGAALSPGSSPSISAYLPTQASELAPPPTAARTPPPQPIRATDYNVFNCSDIVLGSSGDTRGRAIRVWLKDDSVPGSHFTDVADLKGLLVGQECGQPGVSVGSSNLHPKVGHVYEIHVNSATRDSVTCAKTATACPLYDVTVTGSTSTHNFDLAIDIL